MAEISTVPGVIWPILVPYSTRLQEEAVRSEAVNGYREPQNILQVVLRTSHVFYQNTL